MQFKTNTICNNKSYSESTCSTIICLSHWLPLTSGGKETEKGQDKVLKALTV